MSRSDGGGESRHVFNCESRTRGEGKAGTAGFRDSQPEAGRGDAGGEPVGCQRR